MNKFLLCFFILFLFLSGCQYTKAERSKEVYTFEGETVSLVNQNGLVIQGLKINYTLTLKGFDPKGEAFAVYNSQFGGDTAYKHVELTDSTKVYNAVKQEISPEEIEMGKKVRFSVRIVNKYFLEVQEITITN